MPTFLRGPRYTKQIPFLSRRMNPPLLPMNAVFEGYSYAITYDMPLRQHFFHGSNTVFVLDLDV